jgi:hypothetical protein
MPVVGRRLLVRFRAGGAWPFSGFDVASRCSFSGFDVAARYSFSGFDVAARCARSLDLTTSSLLVTSSLFGSWLGCEEWRNASQSLDLRKRRILVGCRVGMNVLWISLMGRRAQSKVIC